MRQLNSTASCFGTFVMISLIFFWICIVYNFVNQTTLQLIFLHILIKKTHPWISRFSKNRFYLIMCLFTHWNILWLLKWTKSTCIKKDKIQKLEWHKLWKELHIFNKKLAMLHIPYVYKTCVLKIRSMNDIGPTDTTVIMTSEEVRWRKDWGCIKLQLLTFYLTGRKLERERKRFDANIAKY